MRAKPKFWLYPFIICFGLSVIILSAAVPSEAMYGYADEVLAFYDSGAGPMAGPYGGTYPGSFPVAVSTDVVLGDDSGSSVDFLSLPTGSYVIVGFNDEKVFDAPGDDIFIQEVGGMGEQAGIYVSSDLSTYTYLGTAQDNTTTALDLASIGYTQQVKAVKIVGLDSLGDSPGFDVVNVQAYSAFSRYDFNFQYNDGSGDYYTGYVYAPSSFAADNQGWISVGTQLTKEPAEMGEKSFGGGYYEITAITDGFDASYDKKEYITQYYDGNTYKAIEGVNSDASTTAGTVYVADRTTTDESGYVVTKSQLNTSIAYTQLPKTTINADNGFAWDYTYEIGFFADFNPYKSADAPKLNVDLDIQLTGDDPGATLKNTWETGIEATWNNKYQVQYGSEKYPIVFNLDWVDTNADQTVTVVKATDSSYQTRMTVWYTDQPGGWPNSMAGTVMAHEVGHMFGLYDEYATGATDPATHFTATNALMGDLGAVQERYYNGFLDWLKTQSGQTGLSLVTYSTSTLTNPGGASPGAPPYDDALATAPIQAELASAASQVIWSTYYSQIASLLDEEETYR